MIDLARARRETPGCEQVLHFNNAGASLQPDTVLEAVHNHLELEASVGGYEAAEEAAAPIEGVYHSIAALIGCSPSEVAVVDNATRARDMAFYALVKLPHRPELRNEAEVALTMIRHAQLGRIETFAAESVEDLGMVVAPFFLL